MDPTIGEAGWNNPSHIPTLETLVLPDNRDSVLFKERIDSARTRSSCTKINSSTITKSKDDVCTSSSSFSMSKPTNAARNRRLIHKLLSNSDKNHIVNELVELIGLYQQRIEELNLKLSNYARGRTSDVAVVAASNTITPPAELITPVEAAAAQAIIRLASPEPETSQEERNEEVEAATILGALSTRVEPARADNTPRIIPGVGELQRVELPNGHHVMVPPLYSIISKRRLTHLESGNQKLLKMKQHMVRKRYVGSTLGR